MKQSLADAVKTLQKCEMFAVGPVGDGGDISREEAALRIVLQDAKAGQHFKSLIVSKNRTSVLYGYLGLRWLDPARFKKTYHGSVQLDGDVDVMRGCIVAKEPAQDVWLRIMAGEYDPAKGRNR